MQAQGVQLTVFAATDVGRKRTRNEDAFLVADMMQTVPMDATTHPVRVTVGSRGALLAVSDGMGGATGGEVASALTLDALRRSLDSAVATTVEAALQSSVEGANAHVHREAMHSGRLGMGATVTAALIYGGSAYIAEVGDSRAYLLRDGRLVQLTRDQSLVELLTTAGVMTLEEAESSPYRHQIAQAVGTRPSLTVALSRVSLRRRDRILLCSDGLSRKVADQEMASIAEATRPLDAACKALVRRANELGGEDNITVVLAELGGDGLAPSSGRVSVETLREFRG